MNLMNPLILLEKNAPLAMLTINRPARHNSLTPELLREMLAALDEIRADETIRALILRAAGRSFSTGGDLCGFADHLEEIAAYAVEIVGLLNQAILALIDLPIPVIAAVHGMVTGGSLGLVLAADVVLVAPEASFTPYYSVVGFSPDGGWTALLPEIIGKKRAAEILFTNATITAEQAVSWGLANHLVPADQLQSEAERLARGIASKQAGSLRQTKKLFARHDPDLAQRLENERLQFVEQIGKAETQASMLAFLKKMNI
jgi:enoyl-CoA hydratase/carnithine racemase